MSYPAKFGGHKYSGSEDTIIFLCHVTLQVHVIKVLNDFMVRSSSRQLIILPSLVAVGTIVVEI